MSKRLLRYGAFFGLAILTVLLTLSVDVTAAKRVKELVELRGEFEKHWQNDDGTMTAEISVMPLHFRNEVGKWQDIDTRVLPSTSLEYDFEAVANSVKTHFPQNSKGWLKVDVGPGWIKFRPRDSSPARAQAMENRVQYPKFQPGATLEYSIRPGALKESITLNARSAGNSYVFELATHDLKPALESTGAILFRDVSGNAVAEIPPPHMLDTEGHPSWDVRYDLAPDAGGYLLTVTADRAWLDDPNVIYPVRIDPTVQIVAPAGSAASVHSFWPNAFTGNDIDLLTGRDRPWGIFGGVRYARSFIKFPITVDPAKVIQSATFKLTYYQHRGTGSYISYYQVTSPWDENVNWNTQPSVGSAISARTWANGTDNLSQPLYASTVQGWLNGSIANYGLMIRSDENQTADDLRWYYSDNSSTPPILEVTYNRKPSARNVSPPNNAPETLTPTLSWSFSDPDSGDALTNSEVQVASDPNFTTLVWQKALAGAATQVQVDPGVLVGDTTYYWRVRVKDGKLWSDYSSAWSFTAYSASYRATYTYDELGNIKTRSITGKALVTYAIDTMNRVTSDGTRSFTYDANGNMTGRTGGYVYNYDDFDRLTSVESNGTEIAHYTYDGDGNLVKSFEKASPTDSGKTTVIIYDGSKPIYEEEYAGNTTAGTPTATRTYLYVGDQAIGKVDKGSLYYYHRDHLGSTRAISDAAGTVVQKLKYTPYGEKLTETTTLQETKRFTGKPYAAVTGLYYFGARFYDPELGRFITQDPAKDGLNWYAYGNDNPLRYADPDGNVPIDTILDIGFLLFDFGRGIAGDKSAWKDVAIDAAAAAVPYASAAAIKATLRAIDAAKDAKRAAKVAVNAAKRTTERKLNLQLFAKPEQTLRLKDGMRLSVEDALDAAGDFLGKGYKQIGEGMFVSADGTRRVRMTDSDILGKHGEGPHLNFEIGEIETKRNGKETFTVSTNYHVYLIE